MLKVLMTPDYRAGNPYQTLLAAALKDLDVAVSFPRGYRRVLPLWRTVSETRAQVLHLHWLTPFLKGNNALLSAIYAAKLCMDLLAVRISGVRIVWTIHNRVSHESAFPKIEEATQNLVSRLAHAVIVHSQSALKAMRKAGINLDSSRVYIIPHGHYGTAYSEPVSSDMARRALGWPSSGLIYLYFGMVRPYKNVEEIIAAWQSSTELHGHATMVIAGAASDPAYLCELRRLAEGTPGMELRLERIPDDQVHLYFSAADVVVLPFKQILTSGSLLLAMSFGKPVIAPRLEAITETLHGVEDLLYNQNDKHALQEAMRLSASVSTNLQELSRRMLALSEDLNWDRIALRTKSAYMGSGLQS